MDDDVCMRYAHCDGFTDICYDDTGKYIISCGKDGDIRIYDGFEDDDPQSHQMGDSVSSVAFSNDVLYVAVDGKYSVSAYSFPSIEFEEIVAQFNTSVYHIVCSKSGKFIASAGGDFVIKVFNTTDKSLIAFEDHEGPVLSLSFDPKENFLASSSCDGSVRIWALPDQKCIKTFNLFKKSNDLCTTSTFCRIDWSPDGQFLAIPVETEIRFYKRQSWEVQFSLTDACMQQTISIVTYSPFGNYIAAAAVNGQMAVWDVKTKRCVSRKPHEKEVAVCAFKWNPSGQELIFCDVEGQMGLYTSPLSSNTSQENTNNASHSSTNMFIDEFADEDGGDDFEDNAFDIGAIKASLDPKIFPEDSNSALGTASVKSEVVEPKIQVVEAPKAPVQTAFQPSSTPASLEHRFMLWNNIGVIRCYNTEEENSIDVEFHDSNVYHPLHLTNTRNHTVAALSSEALLLGCPKLEGNTSKLECLHFGTWDSNKEWVVEMTEDEEIEAVALGEGFAVCITDKKFVRLFSISGIQCEIFSLPGPVVCCSARNNQLLIVYHKGSGIGNDQCLNMMLVKVKLGGYCVTKECFVPLNPKAFLSWLGFTDEGHPCIVDTSGLVYLLNVSCGSKWIPIANTSSNLKLKSDTYFVIGLSEIKQEIRCILCKGSRYPALLPRPTISVLPFSLPFCEMSTDKGKLEEENLRYSMAHKCLDALLKEGFEVDSEFSSVEKKWMDVLLKMFALATRSDREYRALDVAELMPNPAIVQGAIRYATQRHRIALAERLGEVMNNKLCEEREVHEDDMELLPSEEFSQSLISNSSLLESSQASDGPLLKPKPLSRMKNQTAKSLESSDDTLDVNRSETLLSSNLSIISKSSPQSNPFKSSCKLQNKKEEVSNQIGLDNILNNSMKNINANSSSSNSEEKLENSRFETKKSQQNSNSEKGKTGFTLYLEENMDEIKASQPPDMSEKEVVQIAMKLYRELSKSDKQKYLKSSAANENSTGANASNNSLELKENYLETDVNGKEPSMKRKEKSVADNDDVPKPKKIKTIQGKPSNFTLNKLTQYAFTKTSK